MDDLNIKRFQLERLIKELAEEGYVISVKKEPGKTEEKTGIRIPD